MNIHVREAILADGPAVGKLIFDTIQTVNIRDYTPEQINAWSGDPARFATWEKSHAYVAVNGTQIVGFANLNDTGYLNRFYVSKDHQGLGIGGKLLEKIKAKAKELHLAAIETEASITAKSFFERNGFRVVSEQTVKYNGMDFINYKMTYVSREGNQGEEGNHGVPP